MLQTFYTNGTVLMVAYPQKNMCYIRSKFGAYVAKIRHLCRINSAPVSHKLGTRVA